MVNDERTELELIRKADQVIDSAPELRQACKEILKRLIRMLKAKSGVVLGLDRTGKEFEVIYKIGRSEPKLISKCARTRNIVRGKKSVAVPINIHHKILGVVYVGGINEGKNSTKLISDVETLLDGRFKHEFESHSLQKTFSRYVGETVLSKIMDEPEDEMLTGEKHNVSVMFADVNGFTAFANKHAPERVIAFLNDFFKHMSPVVIKNGGTIDKFIGDEVMAVFGAPIPKARHASEAIRTAIEIRKKAGVILKRYGIKNGGISVGIASGRVISGNIGSDKMTDYTVVGRKVNLASRLTALAGRNEILVDETTRNGSKSHKYRSLGKQNIKGFGTIPVLKVIG